MCRIDGYGFYLPATHIISVTSETITYLNGDNEVKFVSVGIYNARGVIECGEDHGPMPEIYPYYGWSTFALTEVAKKVTPEDEKDEWTSTADGIEWHRTYDKMTGWINGEVASRMSVARYEDSLAVQLAAYNVKREDIYGILHGK